MAARHGRGMGPGEVRSLVLDGARPWRAGQWASLSARVVAQAAIGAGHWRGGRRRRAVAAWAIAAGTALTSWGLATEAPPAPEALTQAPRSGWSPWMALATGMAEVVIGVPWGLRHPRRLAVPAAALGVWPAVLPAAWTVRGAQERRPRMATGGAMATGGWLARLWAISMEPLG
ncbi:MAG: hypothetical protein ACRDZQ_07900 [Acidimicrobiales bacterium]